MYDDIDTRLGVLGASDVTTKLWSTQDYASASYVWNTNFWAYGVDLTSVVAGTSWTDCCAPGDHERRAGVLISPRHVILADHYWRGNSLPTSGITLRFIKQDGTVVTRTITNYLRVGSTDIDIAILDSDVPAGINFAKVLPANYTTYLPSLTSTTTVPTLSLVGGAYDVADTDKQGYVRELNVLSGSMYFTQSTVAQRSAFFGRAVANGDSGNPSFLIINDEPVLLSSATSFSHFGPDYAQNITAINSTMTTLGGGYTLTTADLTSPILFNTY